jgi:DnaJ-domain-containing protein 1
MISPGAKGWINKYFDLVSKGTIKLEVKRPSKMRKLHFMHLTLSNCGIVFGYPQELIFGQDLDDSKWTNEEKLRLLLFEAHLFVFLQINKDKEFDKEEFIDALVSFYQHHNASAIAKAFKFFLKESKLEKLESILAKRVEIKTNLLENKWWVNSLSNAFSYLDVILFDDFVHRESNEALKEYSTFAKNVLTAIILSAYSDGELGKKEREIFDVFLASANLNEKGQEEMKAKLKTGADISEISDFVKNHWLLQRFILDVSILTILSEEDLTNNEIEFLSALCEHLGIPKHDLEENLGLIEGFLLKTGGEFEFMQGSPSYEKVYSRLTNRWTKILMRNKDKLAEEIKDSKELIYLVKKGTTNELTKEEKELVRSHFKEIAKTIPALAIFMLPGGTILLPIVLKIVPDLIPSAFRSNKIEGEDEPKG